MNLSKVIVPKSPSRRCRTETASVAGFFVADDQHVRNLLDLRLANSILDGFRALIEFALMSFGLELCEQFFCCLVVASAIGSTITCTGANHVGKTPA